MISVISPAKSLDFDTPLATDRCSEPLLSDRSARLVDHLSGQTAADLERLMSISPSLSELNAERFRSWTPQVDSSNGRAALLAFDGDVYRGLDAPAAFGTRDYTRSQKTLRILSGLYGVLRPLDLIQPYRLEMGTRLPGPWGENLYDFWSDDITRTLADDIEASPGARALVNLASNEYFGAVDPAGLGARVISPAFLDSKEGAEPKIVSFYAKRARGAMASWMVRERIDTISGLQKFRGLGYRFDRDRSEADRPVFVRAAPA